MEISDNCQELIVGTKGGAAKKAEFRRKGSEEERWNMGEVTQMRGLPWQPGLKARAFPQWKRMLPEAVRWMPGW